jgi:hypothetical protein
MPETKIVCTIELLDPQKHDRAAFSCGISQVDNFFQKTANKLSKSDNLRVYVLTTSDGIVAGFYALNAHSVTYKDLPENFARNRPSRGKIPAVYISMIGRDQRFAQQGIGDRLLADALKRILRISNDLGIAVVMLDVLDCGDPVKVEKRRELYMKYQFRPLPSNPLRLFLPLATLKKLVETD